MMYRRCTTEKAAQQQRILEQCLLEHMLTSPFHEISVSSVCEQAELPRKTFYRLFDRKEDLLDALIDQALLDEESYVPGPSVAPGGMHRFFAYWKSQHKLLEALIRNGKYALLWERAILHTLRESPEIINVFSGDNPEYTRETILFYLSGLFVLVMDWHMSGYKRSIDEISAYVMRIMTTPPAKGHLPTDPYGDPLAWEDGVYHPEHQ